MHWPVWVCFQFQAEAQIELPGNSRVMLCYPYKNVNKSIEVNPYALNPLHARMKHSNTVDELNRYVVMPCKKH